nr:tyrosine-type recombinase/integrase [Rhizobium favelukesii]
MYGKGTKAADHTHHLQHGRGAARLAGRTCRAADEPLFPTQTGKMLSRDALEHRLAKYVEIAARGRPSLQRKRITLHVLRHTAAMRLLRAGVDASVIALWLGHEHIETTHVYLHADLELKERTLAKTTPADTAPGRYRPSDKLLAFLEAL